MQYLLDTSSAIEVLRHPRASIRIQRRISELLPSGIGMSMIAFAELSVGPNLVADPAREREDMLRFVGQFTLLPVDARTCEIFGRVKAQLQREGNLIGDFDTMIAATAIQHDLTLLSNNRKHFDRVDGLTLDPA